ncbi:MULTISPECIES: hypothetical protein [unclassified Rhizobium]|jgi:hypothetical protein|nr:MULTISPECIES: hypothetical protein [unclassified Rhizobium]MBD9449386.1 hypothetical protein [Rhizobium sp. RHZ01]MBD9454659.1 hypothetical protein [Rhizobium sp. RHZ02]NMN69363.1 hypothetical protein [Rhizobium sp. 57MFTsu3.2]
MTQGAFRVFRRRLDVPDASLKYVDAAASKHELEDFGEGAAEFCKA